MSAVGRAPTGSLTPASLNMHITQVPTTAGTGSEVTPISIVTTGATTKMGVVSPILLPDIAILDAALTTGLPASTTAATASLGVRIEARDRVRVRDSEHHRDHGKQAPRKPRP